MLHAFFSDSLQDAQQGLLADVFDQLIGADANPQLQGQQLPKIGTEMTFHGGVTGRQSPQVLLIE